MNEEMTYIYNNIEKINNHNNFIELLKLNNCKYTTNSNGIFLNLNTLSNGLINKIFFMVQSELKSQDNPIYEINNEELLKLSENIKEEKEEEIGDKNSVLTASTKDLSTKYNILNIDSFNKIEKDIISLSKLV